MKFRAIELNHLDEDTILKIREWRNQDFVRKNMIQQHMITEEEHLSYIERLKKDKNRGLFVFYLDDVPFGVYQYMIDPVKREVEDGHYLISQEYQSLGYGAILMYMEQLITYYCFDVDYRVGCVLGSNKKQMDANRKSKLVDVKKNGCTVDGQKTDIYYYRDEVGLPVKGGRVEKLIEQFVNLEPWQTMIIV